MLKEINRDLIAQSFKGHGVEFEIDFNAIGNHYNVLSKEMISYILKKNTYE